MRAKHTKRTTLYRDLIAVAGSTVGYLRAAAARVSAAACAGIEVEAWLASVRSWLPLVEQVIEQTERRVLKGETVPAAEKLVSLFEPRHATSSSRVAATCSTATSST